jgi:uncharacterized CHY-type Zn-finger protein
MYPYTVEPGTPYYTHSLPIFILSADIWTTRHSPESPVPREIPLVPSYYLGPVPNVVAGEDIDVGFCDLHRTHAHNNSDCRLAHGFLCTRTADGCHTPIPAHKQYRTPAIVVPVGGRFYYDQHHYPAYIGPHPATIQTSNETPITATQLAELGHHTIFTAINRRYLNDVDVLGPGTSENSCQQCHRYAESYELWGNRTVVRVRGNNVEDDSYICTVCLSPPLRQAYVQVGRCANCNDHVHLADMLTTKTGVYPNPEQHPKGLVAPLRMPDAGRSTVTSALCSSCVLRVYPWGSMYEMTELWEPDPVPAPTPAIWPVLAAVYHSLSKFTNGITNGSLARHLGLPYEEVATALHILTGYEYVHSIVPLDNLVIFKLPGRDPPVPFGEFYMSMYLPNRL